MKIYTRGGDKGSTSLWGGKRVSKASLRIEAYGTVDELNVQIGMLRDILVNHLATELMVEIQRELFTIGAQLAADPEKQGLKLPELHPEIVEKLEASIDKMEQSLEPLKQFILPGGHMLVSYSHLARVVCRRAERCVIALNAESAVNPAIIIFLNRLSDYFFVFSRFMAKSHGAEELPWAPEN